MASSYYEQKRKELEAAAPGEYASKNQNVIDGLLNKITNRKEFSYDFNADPLYQQYKDQYTKLGNEASMNAVANASALTGGYGNSYAATAGAQANQQYLTELNNMIPSLYNSALNRYQMEGEDLYKQYGVLGEQEDRDYQKYRDQSSDYYKNLDYAMNALNMDRAQENADRDFNYQAERDKVGDQQWQQTFEWDKYTNQRDYDRGVLESDRGFGYQQERDKVADTQWNTAFDYQKLRDQVGDTQWNAELEEKIREANMSHDEFTTQFNEALRQWYFDHGMNPDGTPLYPETEEVYQPPMEEEDEGSGNPPQEVPKQSSGGTQTTEQKKTTTTTTQTKTTAEDYVKQLIDQGLQPVEVANRVQGLGYTGNDYKELMSIASTYSQTKKR